MKANCTGKLKLSSPVSLPYYSLSQMSQKPEITFLQGNSWKGLCEGWGITENSWEAEQLFQFQMYFRLKLWSLGIEVSWDFSCTNFLRLFTAIFRKKPILLTQIAQICNHRQLPILLYY